jgi:hypothetical protein
MRRRVLLRTDGVPILFFDLLASCDDQALAGDDAEKSLWADGAHPAVIGNIWSRLVRVQRVSY